MSPWVRRPKAAAAAAADSRPTVSGSGSDSDDVQILDAPPAAAQDEQLRLQTLRTRNGSLAELPKFNSMLSFSLFRLRFNVLPDRLDSLTAKKQLLPPPEENTPLKLPGTSV